MGLVTEVRTSFKELTHGEVRKGHIDFPFPVGLRRAEPVFL
ncbi:hypothetical protein X907_1777 [Glycocaulis alkaliphilus]|uniref:Uncharacterized protein n=1 Tax=Glycocaulis alkaliphilus TaxID=1434191 RepID=A0A3T0EBG3_9PROT|nr:hypothetical protein X907_1777 [Glycocaulis alkaliphilus]